MIRLVFKQTETIRPGSWMRQAARRAMSRLPARTAARLPVGPPFLRSS